MEVRTLGLAQGSMNHVKEMQGYAKCAQEALYTSY